MIEDIRRWQKTARYSWQGWHATWKREKSLRQWAALNALSALAACLMDLSGGERALVLALGILILVVELLNTAIEETVDFVSEAQDPRAGRAKDAGSAAVAVTALAWLVAWVAVLIG
jgi:diacylglycerol kinase (ATP)